MNPAAPCCSPVKLTREKVTYPTYLPAQPDKNPMFLDKRVYQGSSGKVYPLPFIDRIDSQARPVEWDAIHLENDFVKLTVLPQIGGRIHVGYDKSNGYDFFYRQDVIKPALVGLAGPWISGGVEFNWPQHHRPSTFMPVDVEVEEHADGSKTLWLSEHEPMNRMKGMHGICLHPDKALIELKARVFNRTETTQTFLWWANVATRVHERYQSFFPGDAYFVADHAKRSMSKFPYCKDHYYGVDYAERARSGVPEIETPRNYRPQGDYFANDLSWYANIPVPTSYMCMATEEDFFGGYDHGIGAGVVHVANHHISPGKKQWTWGNHDFGYAWDRNLTDANADGEFPPYVELMAGVYTDNQPDFSFLAPGETKTWSQYWYPIQQIGVPLKANRTAALSMKKSDSGTRVSLASAEILKEIEIRLLGGEDQVLARCELQELLPGSPRQAVLACGLQVGDEFTVQVFSAGREVLRYNSNTKPNAEVPPAAKEPPLPSEIASVEELYLTGLHLYQYRHATRMPEDYWQEGIRRDPGDARCNNALGLWYYRRGEFERAERFFRRAIELLTSLNPNPYDGEAFYHLGLSLRRLGKTEEAYAAFYKATWNQAWKAPAYYALAQIDCCSRNMNTALEHLDFAARVNADDLRVLILKALVLRTCGRLDAAREVLRQVQALDPLDPASRFLLGADCLMDGQTGLDIALDFGQSGMHEVAISLLEAVLASLQKTDSRNLGVTPMLNYTLAWLCERAEDRAKADSYRTSAARERPDYCFPKRLEEVEILNTALIRNPSDSKAAYYLGNLLYDKKRRAEAIQLWQRSAELDPSFSVVWRNLGIARFNVEGDRELARDAYEKAFAANPNDGRVLYERDQLWKRSGVPPQDRLAELERYSEIIAQRDDLSVELCSLYNQTAQPEKARDILESRVFQPWEGGEGQSLAQHTRVYLALGKACLAKNEYKEARRYFETALTSPENLGEARHLLANQSDVFYWLGLACSQLDLISDAETAWRKAAYFKGDFQDMEVKTYSEMTYYSAMSLERLGMEAEAQRLLSDLLRYAKELAEKEAKIDYFATSLPTMLVFDDDLQERQTTTALFLQAQAQVGLGQLKEGKRLIHQVLERDPNHSQAADFICDLLRR